MTGSQLAAAAGFPDPPHCVVGVRSPRALATATVLLVVVTIVLAAVPVGYLVGAREGRALLVDTAFAVGVGVVAPDGAVAVGPCTASGGGARYRLFVVSCAVTASAGGRTRTAPIDALFLQTPPPVGAVGLVGDVPAVRWPAAVLADRWAYLLIPLLPFLAGLSFALGWTRRAQRLAALRHGTVRSVDLLTWGGRPAFAFVDRDGRWSYATASRPMAPLVLDGVRTVGAALVRGRRAELLDGGLAPLELDAPQRMALQERVAALHELGRVRPPLPVDVDEPASETARLARLAAPAVDRTPAWRYEAAWRLVWDASDPAVADRALRIRDEAARALGPRRAHAALRACRGRATGLLDAVEPVATRFAAGADRYRADLDPDGTVPVRRRPLRR